MILFELNIVCCSLFESLTSVDSPAECRVSILPTCSDNLWCLTSQAFAYSLTHYDRQLKPLGYPGNMFFVFDVKLARTSLTHSYPVCYRTPFVYTRHLISVPAVSVLSVAYSSVHPGAFVEWSPYVHHRRTRRQVYHGPTILHGAPYAANGYGRGPQHSIKQRKTLLPRQRLDRPTARASLTIQAPPPPQAPRCSRILPTLAPSPPPISGRTPSGGSGFPQAHRRESSRPDSEFGMAHSSASYLNVMINLIVNMPCKRV